MVTRRGLSVLALVGLTVWATSASGQAPSSGPADTPSLGQIIDAAVARAQAQDEAKAELWFESVVATTVTTLDGEGRERDTEHSLHRRYPLDGAVYEELIERDGEPLGEGARVEEERRKEEFRRELREAARRGETMETDDERQVRFDADLMTRYRAELVGEETVQGERCWVIFFEPREGRLPERTRMDKALNQSSGRLFIAQRDHGIIRIEFALLRPVRYMWGLVASLRTATGRLDFQRVEPSVWLPRTFDIRTDLRVFFRTTRRQIVREWIRRERIGEPVRARSR